MAGFGMAIAGALAGAGKGMLESAKARREAALRAMEIEMRKNEAQADRDWRTEEGEKDRAARSEESRLNREADDRRALAKTETKPRRSQLIDNEDGTVSDYDPDTGTSTLVPDSTGKKPLKKKDGRTTTSKVESLTKSRLDAEKLIEDQLQNEFGENYDAEDVEKRTALQDRRKELRRDAYDRLKISDSAVESGKPMFKIAHPDPKRREAGGIYLLPNGKVGKWNGKGWEIINTGTEE